MPTGPYHRNPALDLTTSGTQERSWDPSRLSHFARQRALELAQANNATVWDEQADEDDAEQEELAPTPISTVQASSWRLRARALMHACMLSHAYMLARARVHACMHVCVHARTRLAIDCVRVSEYHGTFACTNPYHCY